MFLQLKEVGEASIERQMGPSLYSFDTADGILYFPKSPQMGIGAR